MSADDIGNVTSTVAQLEAMLEALAIISDLKLAHVNQHDLAVTLDSMLTEMRSLEELDLNETHPAAIFDPRLT